MYRTKSKQTQVTVDDVIQLDSHCLRCNVLYGFSFQCLVTLRHQHRNRGTNRDSDLVVLTEIFCRRPSRKGRC